jgi:hypothetical protein
MTTTIPYPAEHIHWAGGKIYNQYVTRVHTKTENYCVTNFWNQENSNAGMNFMGSVPSGHQGSYGGTCTSSLITGNQYSHMEGPCTCTNNVCHQKFVHETFPQSKL